MRGEKYTGVSPKLDQHMREGADLRVFHEDLGLAHLPGVLGSSDLVQNGSTSVEHFCLRTPKRRGRMRAL
jgi:hypothetical protein